MYADLTSICHQLMTLRKGPVTHSTLLGKNNFELSRTRVLSVLVKNLGIIHGVLGY